MGILTSSQHHASVLDISPLKKRVAFLWLHAARGKILTVVCAYESNISSDYLAFLEPLDGVLEGVPSRDSLVLLCDFNSPAGNDKLLEVGALEEQPP